MNNVRKIIRESLENMLSEISANDPVVNAILDKILTSGIDSLTSHERKILNSFSDKSIDASAEIEINANKHKKAKGVPGIVGLSASDENLEKNIGRYVKFKKPVDDSEARSLGLLATKGAIYEIIGVQKHWGYVNGEYLPNKIGYRLAAVGIGDNFGRVGDVDMIEFVNNMSEEEAADINRKIYNSAP